VLVRHDVRAELVVLQLRDDLVRVRALLELAHAHAEEAGLRGRHVGRDLGRLDTIWELPGHQVLVVKQADREVLIPAVKEFVTGVDVARGQMTVRTLEGMVEA